MTVTTCFQDVKRVNERRTWERSCPKVFRLVTAAADDSLCEFRKLLFAVLGSCRQSESESLKRICELSLRLALLGNEARGRLISTVPRKKCKSSWPDAKLLTQFDVWYSVTDDSLQSIDGCFLQTSTSWGSSCQWFSQAFSTDVLSSILSDCPTKTQLLDATM